MPVLRGKRGVSPVIATLILVVFAVTLVSVVVNWGVNIEFVEGGSSCEGVDFKIRNVEGNDACIVYNEKRAYLAFVIDNTGVTKISGLDVWMIGSVGTKLSGVSGINIKPGELFVYKGNEIVYEEEKYGLLQQLQFIPKVGAKGEVCPKHVVRAGAIGVCSI